MSRAVREQPDMDVVIVGAGVVGAALAALLQVHRLKVLVVDRGKPPRLSDENPFGGYDLRTLALTLASQSILTNIGAWPAIAEERTAGFSSMEVWEANHQPGIRYESAAIGEPVLGVIVEHSVVQAALLKALVGAGIVPRYEQSVVGYQIGSKGLRVELDNGEYINTRLLIGADGQHSRVRELSGIALSVADYYQHAVVATVATEIAHGQTARQIFLPTGPLAFLPLADATTSSIVWTTTPALAMELVNCDDAEFGRRIAHAFEYRLGEVRWCSERKMFPLRRAHAHRYIAARIALVGDAAHCVHPLAGQGANLGLLDAASLAEVVGEALYHGRDIGAERVLRRYERWRKGETTMVQLALDGLQRLYAAESGELKRLRVAGLTMIDQIVPAKRLIMRYASGLAGDLPRSAQRS